MWNNNRRLRLVCVTFILTVALVIVALADAGVVGEADGWAWTSGGVFAIWVLCLLDV